MHESVKTLTAVQTLKLTALLWVLLLTAGYVLSAQADSGQHSIQSTRASHSLLLDITHAGNRLVAVGDRGHVLYSDDSGTSWQQGRVPSRQMLTAVFFASDSHGWAVGHDAQILHSSDAGASWTLQYTDPDLEAPLLDILFLDTQRGFAVGAYGRALQTMDGGVSWDEISDDLGNDEGSHLNAITRLDDGTLFIVGELGAMFRSLDDGDSWETVDSPYEGSLFGALPAGQPSSLVVYGLRGHVYYSADRGDSWQQAQVEQPGHSRFAQGLAGGTRLNDDSLLLVGHGGALLHSTDGGRSFQARLREDRFSYAAVADRADGDLLLIGQHGVHYAPAFTSQP